MKKLLFIFFTLISSLSYATISEYLTLKEGSQVEYDGTVKVDRPDDSITLYDDDFDMGITIYELRKIKEFGYPPLNLVVRIGNNDSDHKVQYVDEVLNSEDSDKLDNLDSTAFALVNHNHNNRYLKLDASNDPMTDFPTIGNIKVGATFGHSAVVTPGLFIQDYLSVGESTPVNNDSALYLLGTTGIKGLYSSNLTSNNAIVGASTDEAGIVAASTSSYGARGHSTNGYGVSASSIYGSNSSYFNGLLNSAKEKFGSIIYGLGGIESAYASSNPDGYWYFSKCNIDEAYEPYGPFTLTKLDSCFPVYTVPSDGSLTGFSIYFNITTPSRVSRTSDFSTIEDILGYDTDPAPTFIIRVKDSAGNERFALTLHDNNEDSGFTGPHVFRTTYSRDEYQVYQGDTIALEVWWLQPKSLSYMAYPFFGGAIYGVDGQYQEISFNGRSWRIHFTDTNPSPAGNYVYTGDSPSRTTYMNRIISAWESAANTTYSGSPSVAFNTVGSATGEDYPINNTFAVFVANNLTYANLVTSTITGSNTASNFGTPCPSNTGQGGTVDNINCIIKLILD